MADHNHARDNAIEFAKAVPMARLYEVIDNAEATIQTYPKTLSPHVLPSLEAYKEVALKREQAYLAWIEGTN